MLIIVCVIFTDVKNRNPVTGNGVVSWDSKPLNRSTPRVHTGLHAESYKHNGASKTYDYYYIFRT